MPKLTIDGLDYFTEDLTPEGQAILESLRFTQTEIQKIEQAILKCQSCLTAQAQALRDEIEASRIAAL